MEFIQNHGPKTKKVNSFPVLASSIPPGRPICFVRLDRRSFNTFLTVRRTVLNSLCNTSSLSERLFSSSGYQVWNRINTISPEKGEKMMFIDKNETFCAEL
ncbi:hypothetical protein BpHYR1_004513 [Brachionus plicatilis]|uniref:HAT C-terminal dimerisation domain-containing protein n=1 Tax=Brachionus plicatilis TaxID=10195 RepID=A0A3M7SJ23_BRAPC|nr:hypothetical protein BpHYR1_004513 [Brachionus plicatilis]